jgi:hypothetical protein
MDYSKVRDLLHSPIYVARAPSKRRETPAEVLSRPVGHWPSLVRDDLWLAVQHQIARHSRVPRQARGTYLLTGFIDCPKCGQRMQGHRQYTSRSYACAKPGVGCWYAGSADMIDCAALDAIGALLVPLYDSTIRARLRAEWAQIGKPAKLDFVHLVDGTRAAGYRGLTPHLPERVSHGSPAERDCTRLPDL